MKLIKEAIELITQLNSKTSDLIKIITTIDYDLICNVDNEVKNLVSEYYNNILIPKEKESNNLQLLKKKLIHII